MMVQCYSGNTEELDFIKIVEKVKKSWERWILRDYRREFREKNWNVRRELKKEESINKKRIEIERRISRRKWIKRRGELRKGGEFIKRVESRERWEFRKRG